MIRERLLSLKKEISSFSRSEVTFILCAMLCGFFICADYSLVRPVSNAVFITAYGASYFAYAWLAMVPFSLLVIALYNRLLPKCSCLKLLFGIVCVIILGNTIAALFLRKGSVLPFLFYIWKDVYVLLLFQQLWAMIHATISLKRAHFLYGLLFSMGALGGIFGSLIPGFFAMKMGSETLLFFSAPICLLLVLFYSFALKHSGIDARLPPTQKRGVKEGVKQIAGSKTLFFILLIVIFMQTASTLLDFQFNDFLQKTILIKDLRTEYTGRVMSLVNTCSFLIQLGGGFLLLAILGVRRAHLMIPFILIINALFSLFFPVFGMITLSFITIKAFDFSLFGIVKEMLYIPMKTEEKFHAKSVIDVFAYRSSKALAAVLILLFKQIALIPLTTLITWMLSLLFLFWVASVYLFFKKDAYGASIID